MQISLGSLAEGVSLQSVVLAWSALQLKMSRAKQMPSDCSPAKAVIKTELLMPKNQEVHV